MLFQVSSAFPQPWDASAVDSVSIGEGGDGGDVWAHAGLNGEGSEGEVGGWGWGGGSIGVVRWAFSCEMGKKGTVEGGGG